VHEAADFVVLPQAGYPQPVIDHIKTVHTDVTALGSIASEAGVRTPAASHLSPVDPSLVSDEQRRRHLRQSARQADFGGDMVLGTDLLRVPVGRRVGAR